MALTTAKATGSGLTKLDPAILTVYSREVLFAAQPILRYEQVATRKDELSVLPGHTIQFLKYNELTASALLTEGTDIAENALSASSIQLTVLEYGAAYKVSELLLTSAFDDTLLSAAKLLGHHFAKTRDGLLRDALLGSANVKYAGGKSRTTFTANDTFDTVTVKDGVEFLATNKAPKIGGDAYICFCHPHQARKLRDDSSWTNANNYGAPTNIFNGEIGRYEDVRFIETTMQPYVDGTDGSVFADGVDTGLGESYTSGVPVYKAVLVADHALGLGIAREAELRDNGVQDFRRNHGLAWYGIWGQGAIETGHVTVLESA